MTVVASPSPSPSVPLSMPPPSPPASPVASPSPSVVGSAPSSEIPPTLVGSQPASGADPAAPPAAGMGHNGGPDWRAMLAGDDTKAIEELSRYKSAGDFLKGHRELRAKFSERAQPAKLADNATPEQVAEYRKGLGLPDVGADATPEIYMAAYKLTPPDGYTPSEFEKGMLGDFAKMAYQKGRDPAAVKDAANFFFQQQQTAAKAAEQVALERRQEWDSALRKEWGRDYETNVAVANSYLKHLTDGDDTAIKQLVGAATPDGGRVGDHPLFAKMLVDLAIQNGMADRIEANAIESGGRSIPDQISEIMSWQRSPDPALRQRYNEASGPGGRLMKLMSIGQSTGVLDDLGNPVAKRR